jgi:hypothetical protein
MTVHTLENKQTNAQQGVSNFLDPPFLLRAALLRPDALLCSTEHPISGGQAAARVSLLTMGRLQNCTSPQMLKQNASASRSDPAVH